MEIIIILKQNFWGNWANRKVMLGSFVYDCQGTLHYEFNSEGKNVNKDM